MIESASPQQTTKIKVPDSHSECRLRSQLRFYLVDEERIYLKAGATFPYERGREESRAEPRTRRKSERTREMIGPSVDCDGVAVLFPASQFTSSEKRRCLLRKALHFLIGRNWGCEISVTGLGGTIKHVLPLGAEW